MATLYEIAMDYQEVLDAMEQPGLTEEELAHLWSLLDELDHDFTAKAEAYARLRQNKKAELAAYEAEIARLTACKNGVEKFIGGLDERFKAAMKAVGAKDVQTGIGKWHYKLNPWSVKSVDMTKLPEKYKKYPEPVPSPNKQLMLKDFKATGELIPGAEFQQTESVSFR